MRSVASGKVNVYYNTLLSVSQIMYPLITFPYASRILGPEGIGLFSFVDSITQYFVLIAAFGIPIYGIREIARNIEDSQLVSRIYSELILLHLSITAVAVIAYVVLFNTVPKMQSASAMFWIGTGILFFNVFPTEWFFQGIQNFVFIAKRTIIIRICSIVGLFLFVREKDDVVIYYGINLVAFVLNSVVNLWYRSKVVRFSYKNLEFRRHLKPLAYLFFCNMAMSIYLLMDSIFLGFLADNKAVGYYVTSARVSKVFVLIVTAFSMVMIPKLSVHFKENNNLGIKKLLQTSFEYIFFLTVPISVGLFLVAEDFITLYAGIEFLPAVATMRIMAPLVLLIGLSNIFGMQILTPKGMENKLLLSVIFGMLVSIILNIILIPKLRENGAAISNVSTEAAVTLISGYYALREVEIVVPWKRFMQAFLTSLTFFPLYFIIMSFEFGYIFRLLLVIACCSTIYLAVQYFFWKNSILVQVLSSIKRRFESQ